VPDPTTPSPLGCCADGLKHRRGSISHRQLQKQEDNPAPFSWVLVPALAVHWVQTRVGTSTGRCSAGVDQADPFACSVFLSVLLFKADIVKFSCWLQIGVSQQTEQQSKRFVSLGVFLFIYKWHAEGHHLLRRYFPPPFLPIVSVFAAWTVP